MSAVENILGHAVRIGTGATCRSNALTHELLTLPDLLDRLGHTLRTDETVEQFHALAGEDKTRAKDAGVFTVGDWSKPVRQAENLHRIQLLVLDIEPAPAQYRMALDLVLGRWLYQAHTTHSHRPDAPRLRAVLPLATDSVTPEQYSRAVDLLSAELAAIAGHACVDAGSRQASRCYFWPSTAQDGAFEAWDNRDDAVALLDPVALLAEADAAGAAPMDPLRVYSGRVLAAVGGGGPAAVRVLAGVDDGGGLADVSAALINARPRLGLTMTELRRDLDRLAPQRWDDYHAWIKMGCALHHETGGSDDGLALWREYSARSAKAAGNSDADTAARWAGFGRQPARQRVTFATVKSWAKADSRTPGDRLAAQLRQRIDALREDATASTDDAHSIAAAIKAAVLDGTLDPARADAEATRLHRAWSKAFGAAPRITQVRGLCGVSGVAGLLPAAGGADTGEGVGAGASRVTAQGVVVREYTVSGRRVTVDADGVIHTDVDHAGEVASIMDGWVWVAGSAEFLNLNTRARCSATGFDGSYTREMPRSQSGGVVRASVLALQEIGIPAVDGSMYHPGMGPVFEYDGQIWANEYRHGDLPALEYGADADDAVAVFTEHVRRLLDDGEGLQAGVLLSWMAWIVQNPGKRVKWCPVLVGPMGCGKTALVDAMQYVLGVANVGTVDPLTLESPFNDWSVGKQVIAFEELKLQGHNRFDIVNKLKPLITNDSIPVHPKGRPAYTAPNITCYIATTNHMDAIPLDRNERRYCVMVAAPASKAQTVRLVCDGDEKGYFDRLHNAIKRHPGAIRRYLLEFNDWHPAFEPDGRAPMTRGAEEMREASNGSGLRVDEAMQEILDAGGPDANWFWVDQLAVLRLLQLSDDAAPRGQSAVWLGRQVADELRVLGFTRICRDRNGGMKAHWWCRDPDTQLPQGWRRMENARLVRLAAAARKRLGWLL